MPNANCCALHWPLVGLILLIGVLAPVWALLARRTGFEYGKADPAITPERFWAAALRTGQTVQVEHDGVIHEMGAIVDPVALIKEPQSK